MHTHLYHALPAVLVAGGFTLAVVDVALTAGRHVLPGSLLLVVAGAVGRLYQDLSRHQRDVPPSVGLRAVPQGSEPTVPSQRGASPPVDRAPHLAAVPSPPVTGPHEPPAWARDAWPPDGRQPTGLRPRVLPHGGLPHQRRASDGS